MRRRDGEEGGATGGGEEVGLHDSEEGCARTRGDKEVGLRDGEEGGARTRRGEEVGLRDGEEGGATGGGEEAGAT